MMLICVAAMLQRGVDARYLMAAGLLLMALGNLWFSRLNLSISPWQVVWPRVVLICGLSMIFAPLNVAAFVRLPRELRPAAVGLLALLRNEGGSVGTSIAQTILERREQFHTLRLNEDLDSLNPTVNQFFTQGSAFTRLNWRPGASAANGAGSARAAAPSTGGIPFLLRRVLELRGGGVRTHLPRSTNAQIIPGKKCSPRCGIGEVRRMDQTHSACARPSSCRIITRTTLRCSTSSWVTVRPIPPTRPAAPVTRMGVIVFVPS
jgi:hypothetical protein